VPLLHCTGELPVATFAVDGISLSVKTKTTIHSTEKPQLKMLAQRKSNFVNYYFYTFGFLIFCSLFLLGFCCSKEFHQRGLSLHYELLLVLF